MRHALRCPGIAFCLKAPAARRYRTNSFSLSSAPSGGGTRSVESSATPSRVTAPVRHAPAPRATTHFFFSNLDPDPTERVPPPESPKTPRSKSPALPSALSPQHQFIFAARRTLRWRDSLRRVFGNALSRHCARTSRTCPSRHHALLLQPRPSVILQRNRREIASAP